MEKQAAKLMHRMRKLSLRSQRDADDAVQIKFRRSDFKGVCACCRKTYIGEFCSRCLEKMKKAFRFSLYKTFSRCHIRKLSIENIDLEMFENDTKLISVLEKWIPILIVPDMLLKTFSLCFSQPSSAYFDLPSVVFQVKSLKTLCLESCRVNHQCKGMVRLECLQTLSLKNLLIDVETLEMLMSSCPLIVNAVLEECDGLTAPKVIRIKHNNLKHLSFHAYLDPIIAESPSIEINAPNLISLSLRDVQLHTNNFENLSSNFPRLEDLALLFCIVHGELKLSSRSIKHLALSVLRDSIKVTINAPNLLDFKIVGEFPQVSLTFATTSSEWKSHVESDFVEFYFEDGDLPWFRNLGELLRALSKSQISLDASFDNLPTNQHIKEGGFNHEPVEVENLRLDNCANSSPSFPHFLNGLFSICRPRYTQTLYNDNGLFDFLCKVLVQEREKRDYFWQKDLEDAGLEVWDKETNEWKPTSKMTSKQDIRFRLKWSEQTNMLIT